jgi:hypothetical protein
LPDGVTARKLGLAASEYGEPVTLVSAPLLESILYAEIFVELLFPTNRNFPEGSMARLTGLVPVEAVLDDELKLPSLELTA